MLQRFFAVVFALVVAAHIAPTVLADFDDIVGVFYEVIGEFRDMDEAVLVYADVDEGAEGGDVGDDALERHAGLQVLEGVDVVAEARRVEGGPRVTPWFLQLVDDVAQGRLADALADVALERDRADQLRVADQAKKAITKLAGMDFHGRELRVNLADQKQQKKRH